MYFQRRRKSQTIIMYYYDAKAGKIKVLPREEIAHLDHHSDAYIESWMKKNSPKYESPTAMHYEAILYSDDRLNGFVEVWCDYLLNVRKRSKNTVNMHRHALLKHVIPYFLSQDPPLKDPEHWPSISPKYHLWLAEYRPHFVRSSVVRMCQTLKRFYSFLGEENLVMVHSPLIVRIPGADPDENQTPLKFTLQPEDIYEFVKSSKREDLKLLALIGFFMSLRPQEIFALTPSDFRAGSLVQGLEAAKAMRRSKLFDRLAVQIKRQKRSNKDMARPKSNSRGWVCCFEEDAARLILNLITDKNPDDLLFTIGNDVVAKYWRREGIKDVTLKDLRRASLYYLGHYTEFGHNIIDLMKHARHSKFDTTKLYLRRPEEDLEENIDLDLDA